MQALSQQGFHIIIIASVTCNSRRYKFHPKERKTHIIKRAPKGEYLYLEYEWKKFKTAPISIATVCNLKKKKQIFVILAYKLCASHWYCGDNDTSYQTRVEINSLWSIKLYLIDPHRLPQALNLLWMTSIVTSITYSPTRFRKMERKI